MNSIHVSLGREACYSGKSVNAAKLLASGRDYCPGIDNYDSNTRPPAMKGPDGKYPVAVPGQYKPFA